MKMAYYLKERRNPEFDKPYYVPQGQITAKKAKEIEKTLYGNGNMLRFKSKKAYNTKIEELQTAGFFVH